MVEGGQEGPLYEISSEGDSQPPREARLEVCAWKKGFSQFSGDLTTHMWERLYVNQDANVGKVSHKTIWK